MHANLSRKSSKAISGKGSNLGQVMKVGRFSYIFRMR